MTTLANIIVNIEETMTRVRFHLTEYVCSGTKAFVNLQTINVDSYMSIFHPVGFKINVSNWTANISMVRKPTCILF